MKNSRAKLLLVLMLSGLWISAGCANGETVEIDDSNNNDSGNSGDNSGNSGNSGNNGSGNNGSGDNGSGNNGGGDNTVVDDITGNGSNSCSNSLKLVVDESVDGKTSDGSSYNSNGSCSDKNATLSKTLSVVELKADEPGLYDIKVSASTSGWGAFEASECKPSKAVSNSCRIASSKKESVLTSLLDTNTRYLFVGQLTDHRDDVSYKIDMYQSEHYICADYKGKANYIQIQSEPQTIPGDTANGVSALAWDKEHGSTGCNMFGTGGNDMAYIFHTDKNIKINAELDITDEDDLKKIKTKKVALYLVSCDSIDPTDLYGKPKQCKDAVVGEDSVSLSLSVDVPAGNYGLIVDSDGPSYKYNLTVSGK